MTAEPQRLEPSAPLPPPPLLPSPVTLRVFWPRHLVTIGRASTEQRSFLVGWRTSPSLVCVACSVNATEVWTMCDDHDHHMSSSVLTSFRAQLETLETALGTDTELAALWRYCGSQATVLGELRDTTRHQRPLESRPWLQVMLATAPAATHSMRLPQIVAVPEQGSCNHGEIQVLMYHLPSAEHVVSLEPMVFDTRCKRWQQQQQQQHADSSELERCLLQINVSCLVTARLEQALAARDSMAPSSSNKSSRQQQQQHTWRASNRADTAATYLARIQAYGITSPTTSWRARGTELEWSLSLSRAGGCCCYSVSCR